MSHEIRLPLEIINYKHINSKKDNKPYTIVEAIAKFGPMQRAVVDIFVEGHVHYSEGAHEAVLNLGVNQQRRFEARCTAIVKVQAKAAA